MTGRDVARPSPHIRGDWPRVVEVTAELPPGFDAILSEARRQGHEFVERFFATWRQAGNLYDRPDEGVFAAYLNDRLSGIAAMGIDPYAHDPSIGRLRHVFVLRAARGQGVATALVRACLKRGRGFATIRLRTSNLDAARLYERFGFAPVALRDASHIYWRPGSG